MFRVGSGFDNHRLADGRKLLLGGVEIPSPVGEVAHSDGDVLLHALCDALYGALGKGDIGEHFPDNDPRWRGQPSTLFLDHALRLVKESGYRLVNVDATVFLEKVKLSAHKARIAESIRFQAQHYGSIPGDAISVKAKTWEGRDSVGRGEAVAAQVVVLLARQA